jgi:BirA family biotin operon repressor/biotin-[acetyl-CoA-carboxylase] ligase
VVAGTGVNLVSCPDGLDHPVTCLAREGFGVLAPAAVLAAYLVELARWLERWRAAGFGAVRQAWLARGFGLGAEIRLRLGQGELRARWLDLTDTGSLLVEQAGGRRREIATGDVLYLDR